MALEEADLAKLGQMIAAAMAPLAANMTPEALAKMITPIIEAQNKAAGVVTAADLKSREDAAKVASDAAAKAETDRVAAEKLAADGKGKDKVDPALAAIQAELAAMKARSDAAEKALQTANDANRTKALHDSARDSLIKAGIPADRVPFAMSHLKESGVLVYEGDRAGWKGTDPKLNVPAVLDMESAAKSWAEGDGKLFLPPVGAAGTGEGGGNRSGVRGTTGEVSLESLRASAGSTIMGALNNVG